MKSLFWCIWSLSFEWNGKNPLCCLNTCLYTPLLKKTQKNLSTRCHWCKTITNQYCNSDYFSSFVSKVGQETFAETPFFMLTAPTPTIAQLLLLGHSMSLVAASRVFQLPWMRNCGHKGIHLLLQLFKAALVPRELQAMAAFLLRQLSCLQNLQNKANGMLKALLVKVPDIPMKDIKAK